MAALLEQNKQDVTFYFAGPIVSYNVLERIYCVTVNSKESPCNLELLIEEMEMVLSYTSSYLIPINCLCSTESLSVSAQQVS